MRLELETHTLDDNTDRYEYGSGNRGVQPAFGIYIAVVRLGVEIDKSV